MLHFTPIPPVAGAGGIVLGMNGFFCARRLKTHADSSCSCKMLPLTIFSALKELEAGRGMLASTTPSPQDEGLFCGAEKPDGPHKVRIIGSNSLIGTSPGISRSIVRRGPIIVTSSVCIGYCVCNTVKPGTHKGCHYISNRELSGLEATRNAGVGFRVGSRSLA